MLLVCSNPFSRQSPREVPGSKPLARAVWAAALAALVGVATLVEMAASRVVAAEPGELRAYPLRHASAAQVETVFRQLLGPAAAGARVEIDAAANQLLVAASPEVQALAAQLVEALDQPQRGAPGAAPLLRAYPFTGGNPAFAAEQLAAQLRGLDGRTRVTADAPSGQILVWAPAAVQAEVAGRLELLATAPAAAGNAPAADRLVEVTAVPLVHARVDQVEPILRGMFGARLIPQPARAGEGASYQLQTSGAAPARLVLDPAGGRVIVQGPARVVAQLQRLLAVLDTPRSADGRVTRVMPLGRADLSKVREAVDAFRAPGRPAGAAPGEPPPEAGAAGRRGSRIEPAAYQGLIERRGASVRRLPDHVALQPELPGAGGVPLPSGEPAGGVPDVAGEVAIPAELPPGENEDSVRRRLRELGTDVEVEALPDLDVIILRGNQRDVDEVIRIIQEIERLSAQAEPEVEVYPLTHVASDKLVTLINQVKLDLLGTRQGDCTVTALVKPNAVLLLGWGEALEAIRNLVAKLDQPVDAQSQLRVFRLKHAQAADTEETITKFFAKRTGLGAKPLVVADPRSNSLVVQADPRDLVEVEHLVERLDTPRGEATNELRVFKLKNTLAADLGPVLQAAISGTGPAAAGQGGAAATARSAVLKFLTIDAQGQKVLESGILGDIRITPDPRTNTLLVSAPPETIELVAALIGQLDALPAAVAQIKVFTIVNGDAAELVEMLRNLLDERGAGPGPQLAGAEGEDSLAPLRFSVDQRTNSIIASGPAGELNIVEAILLRLDQSDVLERKSVVYRLKNAPASEVAQSINEFLRSERIIQQAQAQAASLTRRIETEVVVVAEIISNSLIISATPRYFDEILRVVEELDAQPPQVLIQLLIAEVALNKTDEFGVELGLQDGLLFDRGVLGGAITSQISSGGLVTGQTVTTTNNVPGFNFNNQPLGNTASPRALRGSDQVGGQGLSSFSLGRTNADLGFGGLVLSASSSSVNVLLRALKERRRLDILSRPQVMTLDNQPAYIQVGQRVPRVTTAQITQFGSVNSVELYNIGLILLVTPRISPEGLIVMEIDTERSAIDRSEPEVAVGIGLLGAQITQPVFSTTTARTTISANNGQTIVLGGLITTESRRRTRRVPVLGDIPVVGGLFRYDFASKERNELLIILTPHIVKSREDAERLKQMEANRMSWCLADVKKIHGECEICERGDCEHMLAPTEVIYPDVDPHARGIPYEEIPAAQPTGPMLGLPEGDEFELPEPTPAQANPAGLPSPALGPAPPATGPASVIPNGASLPTRPGPSAPVLRAVPSASAPAPAGGVVPTAAAVPAAPAAAGGAR